MGSEVNETERLRAEIEWLRTYRSFSRRNLERADRDYLELAEGRDDIAREARESLVRALGGQFVLAPITHVAVRFQGQVWSFPRPYRHHHILHTISRLREERGEPYLDIDGDGEDGQGFLDATGQYLNRKQALVHALANNQVRDVNDIRAERLFSEDLW